MMDDSCIPRRIVRTWQNHDTPTGDYYARAEDGSVYYVYGGGGQPYDGTGSRIGTTDGRFLYPRGGKR